MRPPLVTLLGLALVCGTAQQARAEAELQLYLEGATYDYDTESWFLEEASDGSSQPVRLWAIGNVGAKGTIEAVRLAVAYEAWCDVEYGDPDAYDPMVPLRFVGSTTNHSGFLDDSTPGEPSFIQQVTDGSVPQLGDLGELGDLPSHGEYGEGIVWQEFLLGDFTETNSPIADFIGTFPEPTDKEGQINVYEIWVDADTSLHGLSLHFDLYNHYEGNNKAKAVFAPFSHDADGTATYIPAPPAYVGLISMALMGLVGYVWQKRRGG